MKSRLQLTTAALLLCCANAAQASFAEPFNLEKADRTSAQTSHFEQFNLEFVDGAPATPIKDTPNDNLEDVSVADDAVALEITSRHLGYGAVIQGEHLIVDDAIATFAFGSSPDARFGLGISALLNVKPPKKVREGPRDRVPLSLGDLSLEELEKLYEEVCKQSATTNGINVISSLEGQLQAPLSVQSE